METVTLSVGEGTLSVDAGGTNVTGLSGNGTDTVSFTGTIDQINALLDGQASGSIVYNDPLDNPAASTALTLTIDDGGNSGSGGAHSGSASATIDITAGQRRAGDLLGRYRGHLGHERKLGFGYWAGSHGLRQRLHRRRSEWRSGQ